MKPRATRVFAAAMAAGAALALAQQPASPPPAFAPPNLTEKGVRALAANCAPCHGPQGRPVAGSAVPALAGRPASEIVGLLGEMKDGKRPSTLMHQIARGFSDAEIAAMAQYFSRQPR